MSIRFINDVHIADRPPLGRAEGYCEQIMSKLEFCKSLCDPDDVTVFTGDLFHVKRPAFVSHGLIQRLIDLFADWPGERWMILGNHDLGEAGIASVPRQPIGVLLKTGSIMLLDEPTLVLQPHGSRITHVLLSPAHYKDTAGPNYYRHHWTEPKPTDVDMVVRVAHGMIFPPGKAPAWGDSIDASKIDTAGFDFMFYGHVHDDHGDYKVGDATFVNYGSLSRVARSTGNYRKVHIAELSWDGSIDKVEVPALAPSEVFIATDERDNENDGDLKAFARELTTALQCGTSVSLEALFSEATEGVEIDVQTRVKAYLEEAGL